jgi:hypothetical protein
VTDKIGLVAGRDDRIRARNKWVRSYGAQSAGDRTALTKNEEKHALPVFHFLKARRPLPGELGESGPPLLDKDRKIRCGHSRGPCNGRSMWTQGRNKETSATFSRCVASRGIQQAEGDLACATSRGNSMEKAVSYWKPRCLTWSEASWIHWSASFRSLDVPLCARWDAHSSLSSLRRQ